MELKRICNLRMEIMELVAWVGGGWRDGVLLERRNWRKGARELEEGKSRNKERMEGAGGRGLLKEEVLEVSKETWNWRE